MIDAFSVEILGSALVSAAEEASIVVVQAAYSAFIVEGSDACASILDRDGRLIANSMATTLAHSSSLRSSLPAIIEEYPLDSMREGDVYAINDVYKGGIHANDVLVYRPIFVEGRVEYFGGTLIHILDMGGATAAGVSALATDVWQEGIQLPAVRLATAAGFNDELMRLIALNSRLPDTTLGDLRALVAGVNVIHRRIGDLIAERGAAPFAAGVDELLSRTDRLMRAEISAFPDGEYRGECSVDNDGIHAGVNHIVRVKVTIEDDRAHIDFTGTDPQTPASINSGFSQSASGALFGFRCFIDPTIPMNEGCYSSISMTLPEGTLVNCTRPFPGGGRFFTVFAATEAIFQALSAADPGKAIAASGILQPYAISGLRADGRAWIHHAYDLGGMGARHGRDGIDAIGVHHGGGRNAIPQTEPVESQFPLRIEAVEMIPDSGGPGRWRGGMGTRTVFRLLTDVRVTMRCDRFENPPSGLFGGLSGRAGGYFRRHLDGTLERLPDKCAMLPLRAGEQFIVETSGGGGLGDPRERDRAAVARDLAEGRVSPDAAARDYH